MARPTPALNLKRLGVMRPHQGLDRRAAEAVRLYLDGRSLQRVGEHLWDVAAPAMSTLEAAGVQRWPVRINQWCRAVPLSRADSKALERKVQIAAERSRGHPLWLVSLAMRTASMPTTARASSRRHTIPPVC